MKNLQNIKLEYGYIIRWSNGGDEGFGSYPYTYYLENINTFESVEITNQEAIKYIISKTNNAFRHDLHLYDNYVNLFQILGIESKSNFKQLLTSYNMSGYKLAKISGISQSLISEWTTQSKNPLMMSLETASKISKSLNITLDQLLEALSK